ncbi:hypothetical protein [Ornithinibacillus halophilus]|uniref:Uncharacterized protein n=1 Tax=Ornithinibacillus halophilus TaxID=930117 RepID=A0A1M5G3I7_9BACI|nr:hypothetical protein [Ornithinibacillus halophilus]SHF98279.1 hypothetical protein SAMN05216225_101149 [Ornithinibacillus halophilus]
MQTKTPQKTVITPTEIEVKKKEMIEVLAKMLKDYSDKKENNS